MKLRYVGMERKRGKGKKINAQKLLDKHNALKIGYWKEENKRKDND